MQVNIEASKVKTASNQLQKVFPKLQNTKLALESLKKINKNLQGVAIEMISSIEQKTSKKNNCQAEIIKLS